MAAPRGLHALARLHGIQTAYRSNEGARVTATPDALRAVLRALGVHADSDAAIRDLLAHRRRELADRVIEPVVVGWRGAGTAGAALRGVVRVRSTDRQREGDIRVRVGLEAGGERSWTVASSSLEAVGVTEVDGRARAELEIPLPDLPAGYHDLAVEMGRGRWEALLMVAPERAMSWEAVADRPAWGVFLPLYAAWGEPGALPDFALLDTLAERVAAKGGAVVGTLPLLAAFLGERPHEPSPYAPVTRLFWNEVYVDPAAAPGFAELPDDERGTLPGGGAPPRQRDPRWFDAGAAMAARRPALEALARRFFDGDPDAELAGFHARNPLAEDYACFRAITEGRGPWGEWPERLQARDVRDGDYDPAVARYHLYVQWLAERQLAAATARAADRGVSLYLDLPLGVHPDGYDVWRERALFARTSSAGAPPDPLAAQGQDWGFPPLHPEAARLDRHRYFIASIRKHLRFAGVLRIDHVMQLHRMFWVPAGDAARGVYVRYPAEELYAVLCLESARAGAVIVGEDLGTVPKAVRRGMKRHGLYGMYVAQFELEVAKGAKGAKALGPRPVPAGAVASVGTHDTPTFAGWWMGRDAEIRRDAGVLSEEEAAREVAGRGRMRAELVRGMVQGPRTGGTPGQPNAEGSEGEGPDPAATAVLSALHAHMAASPAGLVLATLEDLWLEPEPQNVPGTTGDRNWRRRSARPLSALDEGAPAVLLSEMDQARREAE
ncbi:MAG TPA: 4-alpha-glucanotransferase [Longimicrobiales bacterium]|nr:4-alpha-glucanotransferase [Longimicrobiales bacterium]